MNEKNTVYILGAGATRTVKNFDQLRPPLIKDFFTQFLNCKMFQTEKYIEFVKPLFDWIEIYWKKSIDDLKSKEEILSIEEIFSIIQLNIESALINNENSEIEKFSELNFISKAILVEFINQFDVFASYSEDLRKFGSLLFENKANIITFNYDNFIERVIEGASEPRKTYPRFEFNGDLNFKTIVPRKPSQLIKSDYNLSPFNWNCALSYGFKFDELYVLIRGIKTTTNAKKYYSHPENKLSDFKILKLHGSLNWYKFQSCRNNINGGKDIKLTEDQKNQIIYSDAKWYYNFRPNLDGIILDPLIITPILHKKDFYKEFPFNLIWQQAKEYLQNCKKLIIIGYSFSPQDFFSKKLLLDAFLNNKLDELIIINPDPNAAEIAKNLTHFKEEAKIYNNLSVFLENYSIS